MTKVRNRMESLFPSRAPRACSTIFFCTMGAASFQSIFTVCSGQTTMQSAQPMQVFESMSALTERTEMAPEGQWAAHVPQPVQFAGSTNGDTVECWAGFPAREAPPIPRFLMAPPNPEG